MLKRSKISVFSLSIHPFIFFERKISLRLVICLFLVLLCFDITSQAEERYMSSDGRFEYILQEDGTAIISAEIYRILMFLER